MVRPWAKRAALPQSRGFTKDTSNAPSCHSHHLAPLRHYQEYRVNNSLVVHCCSLRSVNTPMPLTPGAWPGCASPVVVEVQEHHLRSDAEAKGLPDVREGVYGSRILCNNSGRVGPLMTTPMLKYQRCIVLFRVGLVLGSEASILGTLIFLCHYEVLLFFFAFFSGCPNINHPNTVRVPFLNKLKTKCLFII